MYEYIKGSIISLSPTNVIIETGNIGYNIQISLFSSEALKKVERQSALIYIHQIVREDALLLFGFSTKEEREMFRLLISVSGIGANIARMMLSSMSAYEIAAAIRNEQVAILKTMKGVGPKTAQRIIVELKDKVEKMAFESEIIEIESNTIREEALSALVMLGFVRKQAEKVIDSLLKKSENRNLSTEEIIKLSLKQL